MRVRLLNGFEMCREAENVTSQPRLHTLMQARLSANQNVRTILVILYTELQYDQLLLHNHFIT